MVKRILIALALLLTLSGAVTYQIVPIDGNNSQEFAAVMNGITPAPVSGVGVTSENLTFNGLVQATDYVISWVPPGQTAGCPLISIRVTGNNQLTGDFLNTSAGSCTPASGTYIAVIVRVH